MFVLASCGIDYSSKRQEIAELFDNVLWHGNWDASTDFEDMRNLRFIQEDEYDQHMETDDLPYEVYSEGHYVILMDDGEVGFAPSKEEIAASKEEEDFLNQEIINDINRMQDEMKEMRERSKVTLDTLKPETRNWILDRLKDF